jgi:hypothetical protein
MQQTLERRIPLARRLDPPRRPRPAEAHGAAPRRPARSLPRRPSRGPQGPVAWWERTAPDADEARWTAVQRLQAHRLERGIPVVEVTRRLAEIGAPLARETLSRILNGKQPTTWETVENLAEVLGVHVDLPR